MTCELLDFYQAGVLKGSRPAVNFPSGFTVADNNVTDAVDVTGSGFAPTPHRNTNHSNRYLDLLAPVAANYNAADQNVDATGPVTIATAPITIAAGLEDYLIPLGLVISVRAGTITVQGILDVWFDVGGVQRSAKYPLYINQTDLTRKPFNAGLILGSVADLTYWKLIKAPGTYTINVIAQRRASADPAAATIIVSDTGYTLMRLERDIP
jgi:hypothetical protein